MLNIIAAAWIVGSAIGFLAISIGTFFTPGKIKRFFDAFASSARTHFTEQAYRLVLGASLVVLSPSMWQSLVFRTLGWLIVATAIGLCCIPWRWHHRYAQRVMPTVYRHFRLFGVLVAGFAVLLLLGVFAGSGSLSDSPL